jgi:hypothetical protein
VVTFTERDRAVFRYFDGERWLFGDPLATRRKLILATAGDLDEILAAVRYRPARPRPAGPGRPPKAAPAAPAKKGKGKKGGSKA